MTGQIKTTIINQGKSKELTDAEIKVQNENIDISEIDKEIIREDAHDEEEAQSIINTEVEVRKRKRAITIAKSKVNKETPSKTLANRPSAGFSQAHAQIHMRQPYGILVGRSKEEGKAPIFGLYAAAKHANFLMTSYRRGCLFASKVLIDIETEMNNVFQNMKLREIENRNFLNETTFMKVDKFSSTVPANIDLSFISPYAYHYTELLLKYDNMVREIFPYYSMRMIDRDEFKKRTNPTARDLRRLLAMGARYFFVGPESFRKKDITYQQATQIFGELNEDIVSRKLRPNLVASPE